MNLKSWPLMAGCAIICIAASQSSVAAATPARGTHHSVAIGRAVTGPIRSLGVDEMPGGPATSNGAGRMQGALMTPVGSVTGSTMRVRSHLRIYNGTPSPTNDGRNRGVDVNPSDHPGYRSPAAIAHAPTRTRTPGHRHVIRHHTTKRRTFHHPWHMHHKARR